MLHQFVVHRQDLLHRRKPFCRVAGRPDVLFLVQQIVLDDQPRLRIQVGALLGHQFQIVVRRQGAVLNLCAPRHSGRANRILIPMHQRRNPCFFASSQAASNCSCESVIPPPCRMLCDAKILIKSAPASFCFSTNARISSGVPVFSPCPNSGSTAVRMRGPGSMPFAMASRSVVGEPMSCTVVKPAIRVTHALEAAAYAASCGVAPAPANLPSLPKNQPMCTCTSIQPGNTVR